MMKYCLISLLIWHFCDANVPRPVKIAAIFDDNSDMRHDLMFVNAIKAGGATCHWKWKPENVQLKRQNINNMNNVALSL